MKRVTIATAIVVVGSILAWNAVEFAGGYSAFPVVVGFFPASVLLLAVAFFASCAAVVAALVSFTQRRFSGAAVVFCVVCVSWLMSPWFLTRQMFLFGFATRLHQLSSPAEIASAAELCLAAAPA